MSLPQDYMLEIGAICLHDEDIPVVPTPTTTRAPISADPSAGEGYPLAVGRPVGQNIILGVIGQPGHVAANGIHHVDIQAALRPVVRVSGAELFYVFPVADKGYALAIMRPPGMQVLSRVVGDVLQPITIDTNNVTLLSEPVPEVEIADRGSR